MCGAFSIIITPTGLREIFQVDPPRSWQPWYNARPGELLPIITAERPGTLTSALWSFVPHWLKNPNGRGVINARAETIATKPYFRGSIKTKRCLIPADGFYEWQRQARTKVPYRFVHKDHQPFALAGLYDELPDGSGNIGFAIITTAANELVAKIHDRMPVMFNRDDDQVWLDPKASPQKVQELLRPYPAELMKMYPVSRRVNYSAHKDKSVIAPLA